MKTKEQKIAMVLTALLFIALSMAIWFFNDSLGLKKEVQSEKLRSEKMLSEKLALSKDIERLKGEISSYLGKNKELDKKLNEMLTKVQQKESQLGKISSRNAQYESDLKKQAADFEAIRNQLQQEIANLTRQLADSESTNRELNNKIAELRGNESELMERNETLSSLLANNYGLEAHKKREKLTVKAKKTRQIAVSFDLPSDRAFNLNFDVTTPDGVKLSNQTSKYLSFKVLENEDEVILTASASPDIVVLPAISTKRVELIYKPDERLKSGIYKIDIYDGKSYLGSSQIRLN